MKIKILFEDKNILAIDKPINVLVHPDEHSRAKTVLDFLKVKYPKVELVHRLDRETSGVLLVAKNKKTHEFLKQQFQDRTIKKIYNTIVNGWVKNDHDIIRKPIGRSPKDFRRRLAGRGARGELKEAITEYIVLKRFLDGKNKFSYLEVRPKTGRTHQIRVHMKFINHPVVGDTLYNPEGAQLKNFKRLALHARSIEFKDLKGKTLKIESTLPAQFKRIKEK